MADDVWWILEIECLKYSFEDIKAVQQTTRILIKEEKK